jgi:hypothetical protein
VRTFVGGSLSSANAHDFEVVVRHSAVRFANLDRDQRNLCCDCFGSMVSMSKGSTNKASCTAVDSIVARAYHRLNLPALAVPPTRM